MQEARGLSQQAVEMVRAPQRRARLSLSRSSSRKALEQELRQPAKPYSLDLMTEPEQVPSGRRSRMSLDSSPEQAVPAWLLGLELEDWVSPLRTCPTCSSSPGSQPFRRERRRSLQSPTPSCCCRVHPHRPRAHPSRTRVGLLQSQ